MIRETSGAYYPTKQEFFGNGGKVDWTRAGWDAGVVRAELARFRIDVTGSDFEADSVTFYNSTYFQAPLTGKYTDKLLANMGPENASYPRFVSYTTSLEIKNIVPDVNYRGGFSMIGNRMVGSGSVEEQAKKLIFSREKKPFLIAGSDGFVVRKDRITADQASVLFNLDGDSIYHPSITFKYMVADREVTLIRRKKGSHRHRIMIRSIRSTCTTTDCTGRSTIR